MTTKHINPKGGRDMDCINSANFEELTAVEANEVEGGGIVITAKMVAAGVGLFAGGVGIGVAIGNAINNILGR